MDQPLKQWRQAKKEGKTKIQKFQYLKNKINFLDEIKNIFQFLEGYYLMKNKNLTRNSGHKIYACEHHNQRKLLKVMLH